MAPIVVGIDVSKDSLDVARVTDTNKDETIEVGTFPNTPDGFRALDKKLKKEAKKADADGVYIIVEPTGGYEQQLVNFALKKGWRVTMPNPFKVRQWAKGIGVRAKTDQLDARILARYGASRPLPEYKPLPEKVAKLDSLLKRKEEMEGNLRREENRLHARKAQGIEAGPVIESIERTISSIQQEIENLDRSIKAHIQEHSDLAEQAKKLKTVPGIGDRNCLSILVLMHRWDTITEGRGSGKQLSAYVGLDPLPYDSGTSVHRHPGISREGNSNMRKRLYMSSFGALRGNNRLSEFYHRLVARGKKKKLAIVAGARKIVVWAWAVFRNNTTFDAQWMVSASN